jgi:putative endonuclease
MWIVYILKLSNGAYYTGITNNLDRRLNAHNSGKGSKCVKAKLPAVLVYTEHVLTKSLALKREAKIKKLSHKQKAELVGEKHE